MTLFRRLLTVLDVWADTFNVLEIDNTELF